METDFEVLIIGGGPAGLSAALALGRMLRSALVCDDGRPRNLASSHVNNLPSQDGINPAIWREHVREDLKKYKTIQLSNAAVMSVHKKAEIFQVQLSSGETKSFKKVILAYGVKDKLPDAPGFQELWGTSVFHCHYCHGYEVQGKRLGIVANGIFVEHMLPMILGLSRDVIVFTNGKSEIDSDFTKLMILNNVQLEESKIHSLSQDAGLLSAVVLESGSTIRRDSLFLGPLPPLEMKASFGEDLGCEKVQLGFYKVLEMGKSTVPGVFVAGDIMSMQQSVLGAAGLGQAAGAGAAYELLGENFRDARLNA